MRSPCTNFHPSNSLSKWPPQIKHRNLSRIPNSPWHQAPLKTISSSHLTLRNSRSTRRQLSWCFQARTSPDYHISLIKRQQASWTTRAGLRLVRESIRRLRLPSMKKRMRCWTDRECRGWAIRCMRYKSHKWVRCQTSRKMRTACPLILWFLWTRRDSLRICKAFPNLQLSHQGSRFSLPRILARPKADRSTMCRG